MLENINNYIYLHFEKFDKLTNLQPLLGYVICAIKFYCKKSCFTNKIKSQQDLKTND